MSEAAQRLLRADAPIAQPMLSRSGIGVEAHRVRLIIRATISDQQLVRARNSESNRSRTSTSDVPASSLSKSAPA
jgi:hypothetical protein